MLPPTVVSRVSFEVSTKIDSAPERRTVEGVRARKELHKKVCVLLTSAVGPSQLLACLLFARIGSLLRKRITSRSEHGIERRTIQTKTPATAENDSRNYEMTGTPEMNRPSIEFLHAGFALAKILAYGTLTSSSPSIST